MKEIIFAHITDLHIVSENETANGVKVRENFLKILDSINNQIDKIDHIVITGDLCFHEGSIETYQWIKDQLDKLNKHYFIVPGNHDNVDFISSVFNLPLEYLKEDELYYKKDFGFGEAIFLDTSKEYLSDNQLEWLKEQFLESDKNFILFMHHPPVKAGNSFMDNNHALKNIKEVNQLLNDYESNIPVFCGHYHSEKELQIKNVNLFITPSGFFQFDDVCEDFKVGSYDIGWRKITWHPKGIHTTVSYIENLIN